MSPIDGLEQDGYSAAASKSHLPGLRVSHAIIQATKAAPCRNQFESLNDDVAFDTTAADGAFENSVVADHQMGSRPPRRRPPGLDHCGKRSEEHTSELQSLMRISYAVFCLKKKNILHNDGNPTTTQQ